MKLKTTKSSFSSVYVRLLFIAFTVIASFYGLSRYFIAPQLISSRAEAVSSLIRSHENDILLNRIRALRDELRNSGIVASDTQFHHYSSSDGADVLPALQKCEFISPTICLGESKSIFLAANSAAAPRDDFKFAVVLDANLSSPPAALFLGEALFSLLVGLAFWLLYRAISNKEEYLLDRLTVATSAFQEVKELFSDTQPANDEFDTLGKSVDELVQALKESKLLIADYKNKFERKTRLEQLGLTVGQVSHDLKAPLNEADNFLTALPELMKDVSPDEIRQATQSLLARIRAGKLALNQALQNTKRINVAREELDIREFLEKITTRARENSLLRGLSFELSFPTSHKIMGDRMRLETALLNLFQNTADEKPDALVRVNSTNTEFGFTTLTYQDNGGGIPTECLDKVFEPLVTYKSSGTGFGLSSTKEILTQHGGQIRAVQNQGGAKFEIILPVLGEANA